MITNMTPEESRKWLLKFDNPKTKQQVELLQNNKKFQQDIHILQHKWNSFRKPYKPLIEEFVTVAANITMRQYLKSNKGKHITANAKEKNKLLSLTKPIKEDPLTNNQFNQDVYTLCRKYKLYPITLWRYSITFYILTDDFTPSNLYSGIGLQNYLPIVDILRIPRGMNFDIKMEPNKETGEEELWIQIFENTTIKELKAHWNVINDRQALLRQSEGISKRYYPLQDKNIEIAKKILKLDETNQSDWEKQEKIYGEILDTNFGPQEVKRKNQLKSMRHRYKKKFDV